MELECVNEESICVSYTTSMELECVLIASFIIGKMCFEKRLELLLLPIFISPLSPVFPCRFESGNNGEEEGEGEEGEGGEGEGDVEEVGRDDVDDDKRILGGGGDNNGDNDGD